MRGPVVLRPLSVVVVVIVALASGCTPTCSEVCRKVRDCELDSPRTTQDECVTACEQQEALYDAWEDEDKLDAYHEERRCLGRSSCEEIADGVCYQDEEIWVF